MYECVKPFGPTISPSDCAYFTIDQNVCPGSNDQINSCNDVVKFLKCFNSNLANELAINFVMTTTTIPKGTTTLHQITRWPTAAPIRPCGTFVPYDTVRNAAALALYGVEAGVHFRNNSKEYVGYGNFLKSHCKDENQSPAPGPLLLNPAGARMICGEDDFDSESVYYLLTHPNLKWVSTDATKLLDVPRTLKFNRGSYPFMFGRIFYDGAYRLGKLHAGIEHTRIYIKTERGEESFNSDFEVLTCV